MKKILLAACFLAIGQMVFGQSETNKPGSKATKVYKASVAEEGTVSAFESNLAAGRLTLVKLMSKNGEGSFNTSYSVKLKNTSFNLGKPFPVTLSRESFESYFQKSSTEVSQKWPEMLNYIQSKKLSLNDEPSWIKAVNYFNSL